MASDTTCPACGAPVDIRAGGSVSMVCPYCDTTLVRKDQGIEDIGKISKLVPDASPICIGAGGTFEGKTFDVVGRLQLEHAVGYWNEWFLLFREGETGWLAEAAGEYFVTFPVELSKVAGLPEDKDELRPGKHVKIEGRRYTVTDARTSRCTGGEGELPFVVGNGYEFAYADLRRPDARYATIDLSEQTPLVFAGRAATWDELKLEGHREFDGWD